MAMKTSICLVFFALCVSCSVQWTNTELGVCYRSVTRYRISYRSTQSGYESYSCGFLWLGRCRRATYRRMSYRASYFVAARHCCSGYSECIQNSSRCCQDECNSRRTNNCDQICTETDANYTCSCHSGYSLASNRHSCNDIDECRYSSNRCTQLCRNTVGSYFCSCRTGYRLASDRRRCNDINECAEGTNQCTQICMNTVGSYYCSCKSDYCLGSDGLTCDYNAFLLKPSNSRVTLGENATFHCQFPGTDAIEWKVNNLSLSEQTDMNINDLTEQNVSGNVHTLNIVALKPYNETTVKCFARSITNQCRQEAESDTVNLLIQGRLEAVTDLHITDSPGQILITWQPPFTLNLTDITYSITYCIDIVEVSSGKHYVSVCNISETQYSFRIFSEIKYDIRLIITVTPENSLGRGMEQNASVNSIIYCQHNCHNDYGNGEVSVWQKIGVSASVISIFFTISCLASCIWWIIKRIRSPEPKHANVPDNTANRNLNVNVDANNRSQRRHPPTSKYQVNGRRHTVSTAKQFRNQGPHKTLL